MRCDFTVQFLVLIPDEQMKDEMAGTTAIVTILKNNKIYCVRISLCV